MNEYAETVEKLPTGLTTYDSTSEGMAWNLAKSPNPTRSERRRLGEQLLRDSSEAAERLAETVREPAKVQVYEKATWISHFLRRKI
jgi:hypothetical protein